MSNQRAFKKPSSTLPERRRKRRKYPPFHDKTKREQAVISGQKVSLTQVIALLNISKTTIYKWQRNPAMTFPVPYLFGSVRRWDKAEILAWAEARRGRPGYSTMPRLKGLAELHTANATAAGAAR